MTAQYLEFVRQQLIVATADLSGATKGQLVAFAENAQFTATARSRGRKKVYSEAKQKMVNPDGPPMSGSQSRAKGSSIALVLPVEYSTASWRRALLSLEEHQKAWLLWNYSENIRFEYQVAITQWAWEEFRGQLGAKKVAGKTMERLKKLTWLAAQDVKAELAGRETYEYQALAELVGVAKSTWTETYLPHWLALRSSFVKLDSDSLISVTRSRSQQKATNLDVSLAKPN
ncbi:bacteriophage antitermination protein Q [Klebsiella pneumoniae]|uniref:bacteriophage antitermination protein Q n=1 Tax=Klebsiella pneumoniae TaxID=573 RepID=UPI0002AA8DF4|nr:bacteriophage antitermination protein Q [Klebsiella pneumoniae]HDT0647283.1 antiterminator [Klebsiella pneumoniae subsp. ozaenae]HDU5051434.1 antiterminator [Klebsiella pneumoniae subsp. pneumoniae]EKW8561464.1 antiterminator [Klebsiella pneumoniae]ELA1328996.1 antiterminator [Klebsiella pneumoniae]ELA2095263.1 antiterminator [Klebsiella pneumoniae]